MSARHWCIGLAIVLLIAGGLIWRVRSTANAEGERLLRRAKETEQAAAANARMKMLPAGNFDATGTTSSGKQLTASFGAIGDGSGRVSGYVPRLDQPLEEGETATLNLPGGGMIIMGASPDGQAAPATKSP
ncbi:MAG TPA: hypothetical protein VG125_23260 [Pirellulales bacterium]|nr:hypothetical protein [Pirellulales bacterium]